MTKPSPEQIQQAIASLKERMSVPANQGLVTVWKCDVEILIKALGEPEKGVESEHSV